jgi:hypothetical protein
MSFFSLFKKDYSRNFSEQVIAKDYDRFASMAGIILAPEARAKIIRDIYAEGPAEYPELRRGLKRTLLKLSKEG